LDEGNGDEDEERDGDGIAVGIRELLEGVGYEKE
jgi:hypothetical protein